MDSITVFRRVVFAGVVCCSVGMSLGVHAQQKQLTVEELEQYIVEKKAKLERSLANRDKTKDKVVKVKELLAKQEKRRAAVEEELETLCKEQEVLKPGSYDGCKSRSGS